MRLIDANKLKEKVHMDEYMGEKIFYVYESDIDEEPTVDAVDAIVWHPCHMDYTYGLTLVGDELPVDEQWVWWKFKDGAVLKARMKEDVQDGFWPPCGKEEQDIVAWGEDENYKGGYRSEDAPWD